MFRVLQLLISCYLTIKLVYSQDWQRIANQSDVLCRTLTVDVNSTIVFEELSAISLLQCSYKCKKRSSVSFYYIEIEGTCYCNDGLDFNIDGGNSSKPKVVYGVFRSGEVFRNQNFRKWSINPESSDCYHYYLSGYVTDGVYYIKINGSTGFEVWCDMVNGGWTVFQNRYDGSVNFSRGWTDYRNGFGDLLGELWLGLDYLHYLAELPCEVMMEMSAPQGKTPEYGYLKISKLTVGGHETNFTLLHESVHTNCYTEVSQEYFLNGRQFSTPDVDNDVDSIRHCAKLYNSGWWFSFCHIINLNGVYGPSSGYAQGLVFKVCWEYYTSVVKSKMKLKRTR